MSCRPLDAPFTEAEYPGNHHQCLDVVVFPDHATVTLCIDGCPEVLTHNALVEDDHCFGERSQHGPNAEHSRDWLNEDLRPFETTRVALSNGEVVYWCAQTVDWLREIHGRQR